MASAGQAQAHSSQPTHFSSPSGWRLSWWRPCQRGAAGGKSSGYSSVTTFLNIVEKVTPKPSKNSNTVDLLRGSAELVTPWCGHLEVQRRDRVVRGQLDPVVGLALLGHEERHHEHHGEDDAERDQQRGDVAALAVAVGADREDRQDPQQADRH